MLALIPLIVSLVPELARLLGGDTAGKIASSVTGIFQQVTGTTDPAKAEQIAKENPQIRAQLKMRLQELVVESQKVELQRYQAQLADVASARSLAVSLAQAKSPMAWGAALISAVIVSGFFGTLVFIVYRGTVDYSPVIANILSIAFGALVAGLTDVRVYWLGSRDKDAAVQQMQAVQASQVKSATDALRDVATSAAPLPTPISLPIPAAPAIATPDNFERCVAIVFAQEGGFVDNPADPGRATNMGITLATLSEWRGKPCTSDEVRGLTKQEAQEIYRTKYWNTMRCASLPAGVDLVVFDMGVHAGQRTSVKILQRIAGVIDDGSVGPLTLEAVARFKPRELIGKFSDARLPYYQSLAGWATFGNGWTRRVVQVRSAAEAMVG